MTALPPPPPRQPARLVHTATSWGAPDTRPGDDHRIDLTLLDGVVLVVWSLLGQLIIGLLVGIVVQAAGADVSSLTEGPSGIALLLVVQSGVLAGALAWLAGRNRLTWRVAGSRRPAGKHLLQGLGFGLLAFAVSASLVVAGTQLTGSDDPAGQALLEPEVLTGPSFWLVLAVVALLAPVLEELTFRGVLFQVLGRRVGWVGGLVLSSAVFAVVHVEVLASGANALVFVVALAGVGAVLALAFNRTRSLLVAVVAHGTFNSVQLLLARYAETFSDVTARL